MANASDIELLRNFTLQNSEDAFAELVRRHINLVYSTALRHTGIAAHAEEITQAVFIILAHKAAKLRPDTILEAWLYETTRLSALSFLRGERRRQLREQESYMQSTFEKTEAVQWSQLGPLLDDAMSRLNKKDREAILLRFFKEKNLNEVAAALQVTEAAAQSRVHRAVDKLQKFFSKRGVTSTAKAITESISANSIQAAPVALAKTVTYVAMVKGAATTSTLTIMKGALKAMTYAKLKFALGIAATLLFASGATTVVLSQISSKPSTSPKAGGTIMSTNLLISPEFVEVPDHLVADLNIRWQPNDSGGATAILTGLEHTNIIDLLKRDRTAKVLGQPGIAFIPPLPGQTRQGGASILKPVQIAGTNAQTGVALHVKASLASDTNSVNLDLNVEFRELVDASLLHDGSQNQIRTTQATVTTTLTLKPNQTIIIKPVYGGGLDSGTAASGSRRLLVFVTPQIKPTVVRLQNIVRTAASSTK